MATETTSDTAAEGMDNAALSAAAVPSASGTKRWYVVHAYSGIEKGVARALQDRIDRAGMQSQFGQILVPVEEVVEVKGGKKSITERHILPATCWSRWR